jgi:chromosome segregation ATPase
MARTFETGHVKNVTNLGELLVILLSFGAAYNPSKKSILIAALQELLSKARNALDRISSLLPACSNAVAAREAAFEPLSKLVTRIVNAIKATDTTGQVDDNAKSLAKKIQGRRSSPKKTEEELTEISSSQTSYDNRLENFSKLIKLLASIPQYAPNEADLKVESLTALYNNLKKLNNDVVVAAVPLTGARIERNEILYAKNTGLVDTTVDVKNYIKSLYGATSPQYRQVSKLTFSSVRKS